MTLATLPSGVRWGTASTKVHKTSLESARRHPTISFRAGCFVAIARGPGSLSQRDFRSVFSNGRHPEARTALSASFFFTQSKSFQGCSICKLYFRLGTEQDNADVQVMDEIAEAFFAGPQRFFRLLVGGDIPNDGQGTKLSVQHHERSGKLRDACLALLRQADKLLIPHFGFFLEFGHDLRPASRVLP